MKCRALHPTETRTEIYLSSQGANFGWLRSRVVLIGRKGELRIIKSCCPNRIIPGPYPCKGDCKTWESRMSVIVRTNDNRQWIVDNRCECRYWQFFSRHPRPFFSFRLLHPFGCTRVLFLVFSFFFFPSFLFMQEDGYAADGVQGGTGHLVWRAGRLVQSCSRY